MRHGTTWAYQRYGCRCRPCRMANRIARRLDYNRHRKARLHAQRWYRHKPERLRARREGYRELHLRRLFAACYTLRDGLHRIPPGLVRLPAAQGAPC